MKKRAYTTCALLCILEYTITYNMKIKLEFHGDKYIYMNILVVVRYY